eukprot:m.128912 g.128912  ORF g.128912 m.128912 type:complete len:50 (+) comp13649_c0_seq1:172-321(+)
MPFLLKVLSCDNCRCKAQCVRMILAAAILRCNQSLINEDKRIATSLIQS